MTTYNHRQAVVATEGTIEVHSPMSFEYADPLYNEGPMTKEMFQGMPFALVFGKSSPWADQCVKSDFTPIVYDYLNFTKGKDVCSVTTKSGKQEPYVVQPISYVPTFMNGGKEVLWPQPAVQVKGNVKIIASGNFPGRVVSIGASDCKVELYGDFTCGHVWRGASGFVDCEGFDMNHIEVYSGLSKSATGVRLLGSNNANVKLHSGVKCEVGNMDTGHVYVQPRRKVNNVETWTECNHAIGSEGYTDWTPLRDALARLQPTFTFASVMLDDFASGCDVNADSVYVCGPDNHIVSKHVTADPRIGWDTSKVPWIDGYVLKGTRVTGECAL